MISERLGFWIWTDRIKKLNERITWKQDRKPETENWKPS